MAKPVRIPFPPTSPVVPLDRFNLPAHWSILGEEAEQTAARERKVEKLITDVFEVAVSHLGQKRAAAAWKRVAQKKPGRPKGAKHPAEDDLLLNMIKFLEKDGVVPKDQIASHLGKLLHRSHPHKFGATPGAIATHARRLREADREQQQAEPLQPKHGFAPRSLLGGARQKSDG